MRYNFDDLQIKTKWIAVVQLFQTEVRLIQQEDRNYVTKEARRKPKTIYDYSLFHNFKPNYYRKKEKKEN